MNKLQSIITEINATITDYKNMITSLQEVEIKTKSNGSDYTSILNHINGANIRKIDKQYYLMYDHESGGKVYSICECLNTLDPAEARQIINESIENISRKIETLKSDLAKIDDTYNLIYSIIDRSAHDIQDILYHADIQNDNVKYQLKEVSQDLYYKIKY